MYNANTGNRKKSKSFAERTTLCVCMRAYVYRVLGSMFVHWGNERTVYTAALYISARWEKIRDTFIPSGQCPYRVLKTPFSVFFFLSSFRLPDGPHNNIARSTVNFINKIYPRACSSDSVVYISYICIYIMYIS